MSIASDVEAFLRKGGTINQVTSKDNAGAKVIIKTNAKGDQRYQGESRLKYNSKGGRK